MLVEVYLDSGCTKESLGLEERSSPVGSVSVHYPVPPTFVWDPKRVMSSSPGVEVPGGEGGSTSGSFDGVVSRCRSSVVGVCRSLLPRGSRVTTPRGPTQHFISVDGKSRL